MGKEIIRVGLVGVGAIAQVAHLPAYRKTRGMELSALCDVDEEKTGIVAQRYGIPNVYSRIDDMLRDGGVDVIDVCVPNHMHFDVVSRAIDSGKDVICEKPLSLNGRDARAIVDLAKKKKVRLLVAFNNRFRMDTSIIKTKIEQGELGRVIYMKTGWIKKKFTLYRQPWTFTRELSGGGAFMDMGIHLVDICLWFLGYPKVRRVEAFTYREHPDRDVEDGGVSSITTEDDVHIFIEVSWGLAVKSGFNYLRVYGTEGSVHLDPFCLYRTIGNKVVERTPKLSKSRENIFTESYRHEIEYFGEVLRKNLPPPRLEEQIILHDVLDAIYESAGNGSEVHPG